MTLLKQLASSKTVVFNVLALVAVVVASEEIKVFVSPERLVEIQSVVNILLRLFTYQAIAEK